MLSKTEISNEIIRILGAKRIERIYSIVGSKPVSFSYLNYVIRKIKIEHELKLKRPVMKIAKKLGISRMTVYRSLGRNKKSFNVTP